MCQIILASPWYKYFACHSAVSQFWLSLVFPLYNRREGPICLVFRIWSQWFITSQSTSNTWKLRSNSARYIHTRMCMCFIFSVLFYFSTNLDTFHFCVCLTPGRAAGDETADQSGGGGEWEVAFRPQIQSCRWISKRPHNTKLHGNVYLCVLKKSYKCFLFLWYNVK